MPRKDGTPHAGDFAPGKPGHAGRTDSGWQGRKKGLSEKARRFAHEYIVDLNPTAALLRAGYKHGPGNSDATRAGILLRTPWVMAEIQTLKAAQAQRLNLKADDVLLELMRLAAVDIGEAFDDAGRLLPIRQIPPDVRRAISGVDVDELPGNVGVTRKVRFWDKKGALELLAKHYRLLVDRVEVNDVSDRAEKLARARERARKAAAAPAEVSSPPADPARPAPG